MDTADVRTRFLRFFERREHTVVPSASLISDDPTLLLVPAGMVPFKPYFLGERTPPYQRAVSVQKCVRTVDIEEVGKTSRHGSFFQMCGNFSFGDYFKETAIPLAWELLTGPVADGGYGLPEDRLWVTVYHDDDEAADLWRAKVGLPPERIQRRGLLDNYWHMGVPGPGGPCSEIYYDRGPDYGPEGGPIVDEERFLEVWNLVFMQYDLSAVRRKDDFDVKGELPTKNIDTGLGLERMATVLQGVDNLFEIDTSRALLDRAAELTGHRYGADVRSDMSLRVVADHVRTGVMLTADGVVPANEGRGYVLRRILRRAVRHLRLLGGHEALMHQLVARTIETMAPQFPELVTDARRLHAVTDAEEESFLQTLRTGTTILDTAVRRTKDSGGELLAGDTAFALHDTYGFPIDLTVEMAAESGLDVDEAGFRRLMDEQRQRAKADSRAKKTGGADVSAYRGVLDTAGPSTFTGYDEIAGEGQVRALLRDGVQTDAAAQGEQVEVVLDRTPFYAEGGGQLADRGLIRVDGALLEVDDVQSPASGLVVHRARVTSGEVRTGQPAYAEVDVERRRAISRSHTATHMVHKAFREALGETATQAGSENSPGRFRFDFAAPGAVPPSVLADVEQRVNVLLAEDLEVRAEVMSQQDAKSVGALALFGEKYGDRVRVVSVGDWARELCGGTHARRSGQLGIVKLLGESSIGAGVRRVEALVGADAYSYLAVEHTLVSRLTEELKVRREDLPDRVANLVAQLREAQRELERLRSGQVLAAGPGLADDARDVFGVALVTHRAPDGTRADDLRRLALDVRGRIPAERPGAVVVAAATEDRPVVVAAVNELARQWGLRAGELVRTAAQVLGGGGGGKDDVAQGGGRDVAAIADALGAVERAVGQRVTAGA